MLMVRITFPLLSVVRAGFLRDSMTVDSGQTHLAGKALVRLGRHLTQVTVIRQSHHLASRQ